MEAGDVIAAGQMADHPLAEVIHEVATARLSGAIRSVRERVKTVVYFEWGEIIFAGTPDGRDRQLSASELAILVQIIKSCVQSKWSVMGGGEGAQSAQVKIRLRFNPDGRLASAPTIVNPQNTPYFLAVSDSALRAVQACEPFPLPTDKYDVWKDMILNFDPREMF